MTAPTFLPGAVQWLGIAKETTYGVPQAAPTAWIPVDSPKWEPKITALTDSALRGYMADTYTQTQGGRVDALSYKSYLYQDSLFHHMMAALGVADPVTSLAATVLTKGTTAASGGTFAAGTFFWVVTALKSGSESAPSNEVTATLVATGTQILTWTTVTGATGYKVYRGTAAGAETTLVATLGAVLTYTDTGIAGTAAVPPVGGAFLHTTSLYNASDATHNAQPPSYTGFLYQGDGKSMQIPGMVLNDAKVSIIANTAPTIDVAWDAMPANIITAPTNTPSTAQMFPPFTAAITVGGVALTQYSDIVIDLKRTTNPVYALTGTPAPLGIFGGALAVTGSLKAIYQGTSDVNLVNLLANNQPAIVVSIYPMNDAAHPLTLQMSVVAYDSAVPAGSNTSYMTLDTNFHALANATDALDGKFSPIQAKILTPSSTAY